MDALSYRPDVMLLDLGLPDMDGIEIIKKIRSWSNLPSLSSPPAARTATRSPPWTPAPMTHLTKPFSVEELLARLRVALRRVRYDTQKTDQEASVYQNAR